MIMITWLWIGAGILMGAFLICAAVYAIGVIVGIRKELRQIKEQKKADSWWRMMNDSNR